MSFKAVSWAMSQTGIRDSQEKLLLVVLAHFLNDSTKQCNPSRDTLMKAACISNSNTLTKKLKSLEEKGLISFQVGKGRSNSYLLHTCSTFTHEVPSRMKHLHTCSTGTFTSEAPVPSPVKHEHRIEHRNEQLLVINNKQLESPSSEGNPQETFELSGETEQKNSPKEKSKSKPKAATFKFNFKELPESWKKYCEQVRPELEPLKLFLDFEFYYTEGSGKDKFFSEKGWASCWQGWVRRNYQKPNQFLNQTSSTNNYQSSNGAPIRYDRNGLRQSGFTDDYYKEDDEDV